MMALCSVFEAAFDTKLMDDNGEPIKSFADDIKEFNSQMVDPTKQYHDEYAL